MLCLKAPLLVPILSFLETMLSVKLKEAENICLSSNELNIGDRIYSFKNYWHTISPS